MSMRITTCGVLVALAQSVSFPSPRRIFQRWLAKLNITLYNMLQAFCFLCGFMSIAETYHNAPFSEDLRSHLEQAEISASTCADQSTICRVTSRLRHTHTDTHTHAHTHTPGWVTKKRFARTVNYAGYGASLLCRFQTLTGSDSREVNSTHICEVCAIQRSLSLSAGSKLGEPRQLILVTLLLTRFCDDIALPIFLCVVRLQREQFVGSALPPTLQLKQWNLSRGCWLNLGFLDRLEDSSLITLWMAVWHNTNVSTCLRLRRT